MQYSSISTVKIVLFAKSWPFAFTIINLSDILYTYPLTILVLKLEQVHFTSWRVKKLWEEWQTV